MTRPFSCTIFRGFYFLIASKHDFYPKKNLLEAVLVSQREAVAIRGVFVPKFWRCRSSKHPQGLKNHRKWFQWNFMVIPSKKKLKLTRISSKQKSWIFFGEVRGWGDTHPIHAPSSWWKPPTSPLISSSASNCELIPEPLQLHHLLQQPGGGAGCRWWFPNWGVYWVKKDTIPETNITPENDGFQ